MLYIAVPIWQQGASNGQCSTRSHKKYKKEETKSNKRECPFNSVQAKIREGSPEGIRVTMEERICERDEFKSGVECRGGDR